ncbi:molybdopterin molybdotransferase [Alteribacillus persepolensis]|uniref:Molybdopterin molybdenumtransferase n=1 Tax=Alteribacillus persepolensis TaxID=568899 RepID=A0A1G8JKU8_9BACI|nr:molybdopterin molybdotransferase [Alteribacillus persepolensis]
MVKQRNPIPVEEAVAKVMQTDISSKTEWVPIEKAYGRYVAEDLKADHDVPPFDKSPYDGFALKAANTQEASREHPVTFEVIGEIGTGSVFEGEVKDFQAVRIMTGAKIPGDCDCVIILKLTKKAGTRTHRHGNQADIKKGR